MVDFLILNWTAGLISGFILLLGAFYISFAVDKLEGSLKTAVVFVVASTFLFAILSFILSIKKLLIFSELSSDNYLWEPYLILFASIFFTLGSVKFFYELKEARDFFWGGKKLREIFKKSPKKKFKYDFKGGL